MKVTKRTDHKQDRDKTEGKMMADGTEVNHNKWDINDLNKETKTLSVVVSSLWVTEGHPQELLSA